MIFGPLIEAHGEENARCFHTSSVFGADRRGSPQYDVTKYGVVALSEGLQALRRGKSGYPSCVRALFVAHSDL